MVQRTKLKQKPRAGAKAHTLLEVKRTCRDHRRRINPTRLTNSDIGLPLGPPSGVTYSRVTIPLERQRRRTQGASSALQLYTREGWAELDDCGPSFAGNATSASLEETLPERCYLVKRSHLLQCARSLLAPRVISLRCQSSDAIGGEADITRTRRACCSDVIDPKRSSRR